MSNKPVKTASMNDAIAGNPAPAKTTQPQSIKKSSPAPAPQPSEAPRAKTTYSSTVADQIKAAATSRAKTDANAISQYGQQVYERELAREIYLLMGDSVEDYFRFDIENLALPEPATARYLPTITVPALPSQD